MHAEGLLPDRVGARAAAAAALLVCCAAAPAPAAAAPKKPGVEVVAGVPAVKGTLDPAAVKRTLKKGVTTLKPCFQAALEANPAAAGVGLLHVRLDDHGEVLMSTILGPVIPARDAPLAKCVREKVADWKVAGVKTPGLGFNVALTFGTDALKRKGPERAAAEARTTADPLPPAGSIAPPPPEAGAEPGEAPVGYVLPATVVSAAGGDEAGWSFEAEEATAEPDPPAAPAPASAPVVAGVPRKTTVEILNVRAGAGLDKLEVEFVVKARLKEAEKCWAEAVAADAALAGGQLVLSVHVVPEKKGGRGKVFSVASVTREIGEGAVGCIETAAALWSFPGPAGAPKSVVTITLKFGVE